MKASENGSGIAVIGVGNEFRRDDGVGWAVVRRLAGHPRHPLPEGVALLAGDGEPARLMGMWQGARLAVVVDAARADAGRPGRIHRLRIEGSRVRRSGATSSHGFALGDAVGLARELDRLPEELIVFAVEGADFSPGLGLSPPAAAAVETVTDRISSLVAAAARCRRTVSGGPGR